MDRIDLITQKGRPKLLDSCDQRKIIRKIKDDPGQSAPKLTRQLFEESGKKVHADLMRQVLQNPWFQR